MLVNYVIDTTLVMPYGMHYVVTRLIGSVRFFFNLDKTLVIGAAYALPKSQGLGELKYSEYDRIVRAIGDPYYTCIGGVNTSYVNARNDNVQLWQNDPVLTQDWRSEGYFESLNQFFGEEKKFEKIVFDISVIKFFTTKEKVDNFATFIHSHLASSGVVVFANNKDNFMKAALEELDVTCEINNLLSDL